MRSLVTEIVPDQLHTETDINMESDKKLKKTITILLTDGFYKR